MPTSAGAHASRTHGNGFTLPSLGQRSISSPSLRQPSAFTSPLTLQAGLRNNHGKHRKMPAVLPSVVAATPIVEKSPQIPQVTEVILPELCAICLEPLGSSEFEFPCGHQHRLHHQCAIEFLGRVLNAAPSSCAMASSQHFAESNTLEASSASLPVQSLASKTAQNPSQCDVRAVGKLEHALRSAPVQVLSRIACPLCRGVWPAQDGNFAGGVIHQLREWSLQRHKHNLERVGEILAQFAWRLAHSEEARLARLARGVEALWNSQHSACSFFASHRAGKRSLLPLLSFLRVEDVAHLRLTSVSCSEACSSQHRLRVPYVRNPRHVNVLHATQPLDVAVVEIDTTSCGSGWSRRGATSELDLVPLSTWIATCTSLRELSLRGLRLDRSDPDGACTARAITKKSNLRVLDLSHNYLTDDFVICLARVLGTEAGGLKVFQLAGNCISHRGFAALLPLHAGGRGVQEWGLRHNKLADEGCYTLASHQLGHSEWDLWTNSITATGCQVLLRSDAFEKMVVLRLGSNPIGDEGVEFLVQGLTNKLQVLDLRQTNLGDTGCLALSAVLSGLSQLRLLLLAGNVIGLEGCKALARAWGCVESLRHVDLSNNSLGSLGVQAIASELPFWLQAKLRLSLVGVGCDEAAVQALRSAIQVQPRSGRSLVLDLQHNGLPLKHIVEMRRLLEAYS
mmetsp:Transcript_29907/g.54460  ORF Transcript_29907/g.54460 Transcript_29907/m.54460 type:complete len:681 (-) Transcript_29907:67-2109(-)